MAEISCAACVSFGRSRHRMSALVGRKAAVMAVKSLRIGLIGAGGNTKLRHIPGLLAQADVTLAGVCNRRPDSTAAIAKEYGIPRTYQHWEALIDDADIDAVVIGTWPYLHCPITLAALERGKHV